jgi:hypothetical protein
MLQRWSIQAHRAKHTHIFTYIAPSSRSGINSDDYAALKPESESGSAVLNFYSAIGICLVIRVHPQEGRWLYFRACLESDAERTTWRTLTSGTSGTRNDGTPFAKEP